MSIELLLYDRSTAGAGNVCQRIDLDVGSPWGWRLLKPFHSEVLTDGYGVYKSATSVVQTFTGPRQGETVTLCTPDGKKRLVDLFAFYWGGGAAGFANIHRDYATIGTATTNGNADWVTLGTAYDWSKVWIGAGAKWGGQCFIGGVETTVAWIWNVADPARSCLLSIRGIRLGPGLGASAGATFVLAVNVDDPVDLLNVTASGFDFSLSLEEKWSAVIKFLGDQSYLPAIGVLASTIVAKGGVMDMGQWESFANYGKLLASAVGVGKDMSLSVFDVPYASKGLELTLCYSWSSVTSLERH